ncbi:MAG: succinate dehydrogenase, cytochrome b556 subunit [Acidobacteria bacterium]|nr:MAG: succinate dehydrogenase, cytochrome b556 subunit [Acidobacteriota bacterium]
MNIKPHEYLTYRGRAGMWAWILHRLTGVGVFVFLLAHIVDTALIGWGPKVYNEAVALYRHPISRVGEAVLAGAVLFHALNGVRIIILDFWPQTMTAEKKLFAGVVGLFAVVYIPMAIYMLRFLVH